MTLPESVKIARAFLEPGTTLEGTPFSMHLGDNEVAILLSLYYWWYGTVAVGENNAALGLWRKTDVNPASFITPHTDMIWCTRDGVAHVAESIKTSEKNHIIFPWPLVLIRPPRLIAFRTSFTFLQVEMRLFYLIQKVSDEELAKLMVKDHA